MAHFKQKSFDPAPINQGVPFGKCVRNKESGEQCAVTGNVHHENCAKSTALVTLAEVLANRIDVFIMFSLLNHSTPSVRVVLLILLHS